MPLAVAPTSSLCVVFALTSVSDVCLCVCLCLCLCLCLCVRVRIRVRVRVRAGRLMPEDRALFLSETARL